MIEINWEIRDSLDAMRELPDKSIYLILTDPPYGINIASKGTVGHSCLAKCKDYGIKNWDESRLDKVFFDEMFRISKNQIIFGGNYYIDYLEPGTSWFVWDKDNSKNNFSDCELMWTSFKGAVRKFRWRWSGMLQEDMKHKDKRYHHTQKPLGLIKNIILKITKEDDLICDPFLGSGTTAVACKQLSRKFIGWEIQEDMREIISMRLAKIKGTQYKLM